MKRRFPVVLLLIACISCGGTTPRAVTSTPWPWGSPIEEPAPEAARASASAMSAARGTTTASPRPRASSSSAPRTPGTGQAGSRNNMPMTVKMSAACVQPGGNMRVDVSTVKGAQVGFAAAYSDNNFPPDIFWVRSEANPTGKVTWAFVIRPTTPTGNGVLEVVAGKGSKGATYEGYFRVASSC
jgi:hypothetical protein